jgi:hypothetical protein
MIHRPPFNPRSRAAFRWAAALTIFVVALTGGVPPGGAALAASSAATAQREYLIKAAFLYELIKSTQWPGKPSAAFRLCMLGSDPFGAAWRSIEGRPVGGRKLHVESRAPGQPLSDCNVLFIGESEKGRVAQILGSLESNPILTVSELAGFAKVGGIIRLMDFDNRLHFKVNLAAAHRTGLTISTEALKLADAVQVEAGAVDDGADD